MSSHLGWAPRWTRAYALLASSRFSLRSATGWFTRSCAREHSAFTGCLIELLRSWSKDDDLPTYTELSVLLEARMRRLEFAQQPQVAGDIDRVLLGRGMAIGRLAGWPGCAAPTSWRKAPRTASTVGLTMGACCKAFGETEDPIRHLDDPVATVQVVNVHDFSSDFVGRAAGLDRRWRTTRSPWRSAGPGVGGQRLVVGTPDGVGEGQSEPRESAPSRNDCRRLPCSTSGRRGQ